MPPRAPVASTDSSVLRVQVRARDSLYGSHNERHANHVCIAREPHAPRCENCHWTACDCAPLVRNPCELSRGDKASARRRDRGRPRTRAPRAERTRQDAKNRTIPYTPVSYTHLRAHETRHDLV